MKLSREDFILIKKCISIIIDNRLHEIESYLKWDNSNLALITKLEKELNNLIELEEKIK